MTTEERIADSLDRIADELEELNEKIDEFGLNRKYERMMKAMREAVDEFKKYKEDWFSERTKQLIGLLKEKGIM